MIRLVKHLLEQPFIFATGLAALVHSTWSLGTLFAGREPQPQFSGAWFAWIVPAFLIAFSLDVGQIVTIAEIRAGQRTRAKYRTFLVFSAATYFLQWLYMAHHIPLLELSAGVREEWRGMAMLIRDAAVWFIPALLPLSTALYTFSYGDPVTEVKSDPRVRTEINIESMQVLQSLQHPVTTAEVLEIPGTLEPTTETGLETGLATWFADSANLEAYRKRRITQAEIARLIGVSGATVSRYVNSNLKGRPIVRRKG